MGPRNFNEFLPTEGELRILGGSPGTIIHPGHLPERTSARLPSERYPREPSEASGCSCRHSGSIQVLRIVPPIKWSEARMAPPSSHRVEDPYDEEVEREVSSQSARCTTDFSEASPLSWRLPPCRPKPLLLEFCLQMIFDKHYKWVKNTFLGSAPRSFP